ncbi:MAG: kelch repeat-containing protein [Longimicrobiales bacterium]
MLRSRRSLRPLFTLLALLAGVAACEEEESPSDPTLGPPETPADTTRPQVFDRVLTGRGGKELARESWVWIPGSGWRPDPYFMPEPGVSDGTIAEGIRRARASGGSVPARASSPPNVDADAALFAGGYGLDGAPAGDQAYFYDGATDRATAVRMSRARVEHTVTALFEGRFLVAGGSDESSVPTATAEVFDAAAMAFAPTGAMAHARWGHAASLLPDGRVLVSGGQDDTGSPVREAEVWDPATGFFSQAGTLAEPRVGHAQITLPDGRVLAIGGAERSDAELWEPETGNFRSTVRMVSRHGMGLTATRLLDGRVLVLGGDGTDGRLQATDQAEIFDPATGTLGRVGPLHSARMRHFAILLPDGRVLIGGGVDESGFPTSSAEIYDPVANRFTTAAAVPEEGSGAAAVFIAGAG